MRKKRRQQKMNFLETMEFYRLKRLYNHKGELITTPEEAREIAYKQEDQAQSDYEPQSEYEG